jgi:hypothetical protein
VGFALGLAIRMWECGKGVEKWEKVWVLLVGGSVENLGLVWRGRKGQKWGEIGLILGPFILQLVSKKTTHSNLWICKEKPQF